MYALSLLAFSNVLVLNFSHMHVMDAMIYDLDDFMILNVKGINYRYFVCYISENTGDL